MPAPGEIWVPVDKPDKDEPLACAAYAEKTRLCRFGLTSSMPLCWPASERE